METFEEIAKKYVFKESDYIISDDPFESFILDCVKSYIVALKKQPTTCYVSLLKITQLKTKYETDRVFLHLHNVEIYNEVGIIIKPLINLKIEILLDRHLEDDHILLIE